MKKSLTQFVYVYDGNGPELCPARPWQLSWYVHRCCTLDFRCLGPVQPDHLFFDQGRLNELSQLPLFVFWGGLVSVTLPVVQLRVRVDFLVGNLWLLVCDVFLQLQQREVLG